MPRTLSLLLTLATLSVGAYAQTTDPAGQSNPTTPQTQSHPAPIVRMAPSSQRYDTQPAGDQAPAPQQPTVTTTQPVAGIWLKTEPTSVVKVVSATADKTEIRVEHGRANVQVHQPTDNSEILVDLPGGQTTLIKDGVYTFNAETNTVRVLKGEAEVYPGTTNAEDKPIKVKEDHELSFTDSASGLKSKDVGQRELFADLLPGSIRPDAGDDNGHEPYGYEPGYGYGFYPYAGYGWGDPWGWGGPFGWGSPYGYGLGLGLGFGYGGFGYGGFGYGGFGGFRGGRFGR